MFLVDNPAESHTVNTSQVSMIVLRDTSPALSLPNCPTPGALGIFYYNEISEALRRIAVISSWLAGR